jgi:small-conductance mechanosensitive channel
MRGLLYEEDSFRIFLLLTVSLGGAAALMTGRAIASAWRPWWHVVVLMLLVGAAVRFLHFALFGGTLLSLQYYMVDTAFCMAFGLLGFRLMRVGQMVSCYGWINERVGTFGWQRRAVNSSESG